MGSFYLCQEVGQETCFIRPLYDEIHLSPFHLQPCGGHGKVFLMELPWY